MYKLNNIEMDIRRTIGDEIKEDLVHPKDKMNFSTDGTKKSNNPDGYSKKSKKQQNMFFTIDGVKEDDIVVSVEKQGDYLREYTQGNIIDKKT